MPGGLLYICCPFAFLPLSFPAPLGTVLSIGLAKTTAFLGGPVFRTEDQALLSLPGLDMETGSLPPSPGSIIGDHQGSLGCAWEQGRGALRTGVRKVVGALGRGPLKL